MSRLETFIQLKNDFELETYVEVVRDRKQRSLIAKARMDTLPIAVETGRYRGTPRQERLCKFCDNNVIEDVNHLMLHCNKYGNLRQLLYENVFINPIGATVTDAELLQTLLASNEPNILFATAKYIHNALMQRSRAS